MISVSLAMAVSVAGCLSTQVSTPVDGRNSPRPLIASPAPAPDNRPSHARNFDFLLGSWTVHNRTLIQRLAGSTEWREWDATLDVVSILRGMGNVDRFVVARPGNAYEGMTVRLYDPSNDIWRLYWTDTDLADIRPQVGGVMGRDGGTFYGREAFQGDSVDIRFRWKHGSGSVTWDQAYRLPDGSWEVNWEMSFVRRTPLPAAASVD